MPVDGAEHSGTWRVLSVWKQPYSASVAMKLYFFLFIFPIFNSVLVICMGGAEKAAFLAFI